MSCLDFGGLGLGNPWRCGSYVLCDDVEVVAVD